MAANHDKKDAGSSALEKLPTELQLMILEHLPAKQIQRSRGISSHFRQLLDRPENQRMCTRQSVKESLERLQRRADFYWNFDADAVDSDGFYIAFWDLLKDFVEERGMCLDMRLGEYPHDVEPVLNAWLARRNLSHGSGQIYLTLTNMIWYILDLHISHHGGQHSISANAAPPDGSEWIISCRWTSYAPFLGPSSRPDILFQRLRNGILSNGRLHTKDEYMHNHEARRYARFRYDGGHPDTSIHCYDQIQAEFTKAFGVPAMPAFSVPAMPVRVPFHYCFRSVWPSWDLHSLCALDSIKKAAMLEDMELQWRW